MTNMMASIASQPVLEIHMAQSAVFPLYVFLSGRRSLLIKLPGGEDTTLMISSITPDSRAEASTWLEVPHGLYRLEIGGEISEQSRAVLIRRHPWSDTLWSQIVPEILIPPVASDGNQVCISKTKALEAATAIFRNFTEPLCPYLNSSSLFYRNPKYRQ